MAEVIKTILAVKAGSSHHGGLEPKATQTGPRRPSGARGQSRLWGWQLPVGFPRLEDRCWAAATVGYQGESKCWWPLIELYVRSRSAEPTRWERPAYIPRDHLMCSLDYFFPLCFITPSACVFHSFSCPSLPFLPVCINICCHLFILAHSCLYFH